ncbi:2-oxo acid dehydrogenase subunit E2 [Sphingomonadaceae bacterium jetA1]|jgi:pyruvate dehydrogenase E2 component (dihydrolipoamide acetyltransferase)|uniref:2-oxo acid dehydrogenase subunit E2 n=1 Tax=Facivitalis istanbulensis TaxID=3075838 RepID=UPI00348A8498
MTSFIEALPDWPTDDFATFGKVTVRKRSRMQQLVGRFLGRNWIRIPHVTHHDEVDVTEVEARRLAWNADHPAHRISPVIPMVKALALALAEHPQFAASLDASGEQLIEKHYAHVGVAVEVPAGLLVPVLRDCDTRPLPELATELAALAEKARTKGLPMTDMTGGCISLSSLGHIGGTGFTPIVNAPEVAIVGMTRVQMRATPGADGEVAWRKMLPLSLSYDHRVINGADAARFVITVGRHLAGLTFA